MTTNVQIVPMTILWNNKGLHLIVKYCFGPRQDQQPKTKQKIRTHAYTIQH
jgi:hypothetical protein